MPKLPRPTAAELEILQVLWRIGPSTVRQVHDALSQDKTTGYTTVLKLLQIMTEKGLVRRDESERAHRYQPCLAMAQTQRRFVVELLDKVFGGSASSLVQQALSAGKTSPEELRKIRLMVEELERGDK